MVKSLRTAAVGLLLLATMCISAYAEGNGPIEMVFTEPELMLAADSFSDGAANEDIEKLTAFLHEQFWAGATSFSIRCEDYPSLVKDDINTALYQLYYYPDMFNLRGGSWRNHYWTGGLHGWSEFEFNRSYPLSGEAYEEAKSIYTDGIERAVAQIRPQWSDLEKTLFVNDYLAVNYQYDPRYQDNSGSQSELNYDAYSFFRDGYGVCNAYTMAVLAIMEELGIPCTYCQSDSMNHIWNVVELDGAWYHMDVTWDDPTPDRLGGARHTYFLCSTADFQTADFQSGYKHFKSDDWKYGMEVVCDSTEYDGWFWKDVTAPLCNYRGVWYCVGTSGISTWDGISNGCEPVVGAERCRTGIGLYGGKLYSADNYSILSFDPLTGETETVATFESKTDNYIMNCGVKGNTIYYKPYKLDTQTIELDPYTATGYGYDFYFDEDGLHLRVEEDASVVLAQYDGGRMRDCAFYDAAGDYTVEVTGQVSLISLDEQYAPRCAAMKREL